MPAFAAFLLLMFSLSAVAESAGERRAEINKRRSETLAKLYQVHPAAKGKIGAAYGYAVFTNLGVNLVIMSVAGGSGVAHDNKTGRDTYMKMLSGGVGLGLGVKDFRGIFLEFRARSHFVTGCLKKIGNSFVGARLTNDSNVNSVYQRF